MGDIGIWLKTGLDICLKSCCKLNEYMNNFCVVVNNTKIVHVLIQLTAAFEMFETVERMTLTSCTHKSSCTYEDD